MWLPFTIVGSFWLAIGIWFVLCIKNAYKEKEDGIMNKIESENDEKKVNLSNNFNELNFNQKQGNNE